MQIYQKHFLLLALFLVVFIDLGCVPQTKESGYTTKSDFCGKKNGDSFRHNWWNYYKQGITCAENKAYDQATLNLDIAKTIRAKDQRRARTYGMHFIDYFPHRETGIICYQKGQYKSAQKELELSIKQCPTAKAFFYLDCVRKALIGQRSQVTNPPTIEFETKTDTIWTRENPVIISGIAKDDNYISNILINNVPLFLEHSAKKISFNKKLKLVQGKYNIEVKAKNLMGKTSTRQLIIHVDREGPTIGLDTVYITDQNNKYIQLSGIIHDVVGLSELTINGQKIHINKKTRSTFLHKIPATTNKIELHATDSIGNTTSAHILLPTVAKQNQSLLLACATQSITNQLIARIISKKNNYFPNIKIEDEDIKNKEIVYQKNIKITVKVDGGINKITSLVINNIPKTLVSFNKVIVSHNIDLSEGVNLVNIKVIDNCGNKSSKTVSITRIIPKALKLEERLSIAIFPFKKLGDVKKPYLIFQDFLITALLKENRFQIVEREHLVQILREHKLSNTGLIDKKTKIKLGKIIQAKAIVTGVIIESEHGVEIVSRMFDTETSEILSAPNIDAYDEVKNISQLKLLAEILANKYHRDFPLVDGYIIQKKDNTILTNIGDGKTRLNRRLIIYRQKPIPGIDFGQNVETIGRASITQLQPEISKAKIIYSNHTICQNDKVITE